MKNKYAKIILFVFLIGVSLFLRFKNLGYSEYQDDEKKAVLAIQSKGLTKDFLLSQRKGPMQFFVASATSLFVEDARNELAYRIPFTLANLLSVYIVWLIFKRIFKNNYVPFLAALIYSVNGLVIGFSRIAQYQNLNLLFSFLSLYLFIRLYQDKKKPFLFSSLGTTSFCISLLSHWDAIFFVIPIAYFYFLYIKEKKFKDSLILTLFNVLLGSLILFPFLIPYVSNYKKNQENIDYFSRRVGLSTYPLLRHKMIFELYNPFLAIYLIPILGSLAFLQPKKNAIWIIWALINFSLIRFLMQKPGTHIYNYVLPVIFLAGGGISTIGSFLKKYKKFIILPIFFLVMFLTYQTYMLFVDHSPEYPWYKKKILSIGKTELIAPQYQDREILTFGFPRFRNWKAINKIVSEDTDNCSYITNEGKEISQIYMENRYGISKEKCHYIIDIKRPFITRGNEAAFAQAKKKYLVYTYKEEDTVLARVYKIPLSD